VYRTQANYLQLNTHANINTTQTNNAPRSDLGLFAAPLQK